MKWTVLWVLILREKLKSALEEVFVVFECTPGKREKGEVKLEGQGGEN